MTHIEGTDLGNPQGAFPVRLPGAADTPGGTLMWAQPWDIETQAADQLRNVSRLPWLHGLRVMPDVHFGKGATVGSVLAMRDAVSPSAVGVDIGCGMAGVKTNLTVNDLPDDLGPLRAAIEVVVPVGFNANNGPAPIIDRRTDLTRAYAQMAKGFPGLAVHDQVADREGRVLAQCGSLGGGNHFIEVCSDGDGVIWLMLHSGSRNIGKEIAERHINRAKTLDHNVDLPDRDLAVFLASTEEMKDYLHDLYWAQDYALLNRRIMMASVKQVMLDHFPTLGIHDEINCHHNYVSEESYDGVDLIVTRKGAISAKTDERALIPGSMGTGSYVVTGLGNEESYCSASHGAGRRMSRSKAKKTFTLEDLAEQTRGVECRKDSGVVDEIPGAYKDLDSVIAAQADLVKVDARLTTLLCVKG